MTKDELKRLGELRDEIAAAEADIARQEEAYWQEHENRKRFAESVMMSSTDEACRVIESRVESGSTSVAEARAKRELKRLQAEYDALVEEYDTLLVEAEAWLCTVGDWRVRRMLRARYIDGWDIIKTADHLNYSVQHVKNVESRFWAETGK